MKTPALEHRYHQLGAIYQLIEQFELISRSDLAKLSGFAPASVTGLTKWLIDKRFIIERTVQNLPTRGRPAVGLSLSPFHYTFLCITLSEHKLTLYECELSGAALRKQDYVLDALNLAVQIPHIFNDFCEDDFQRKNVRLAISVSVIGKISRDKRRIIQLGNTGLDYPIVDILARYFTQPILLNEHFQLWFLAESTLGNLIRYNDVIYLQLDEKVNLSVRLKGELLHQDEHKRMNVDCMLMPNFGRLSEEISEQLSEVERYQLQHQITFSALVRLIDRYLPNSFSNTADKIAWLCYCVERKNSDAEQILVHICDNLAYMLMNLINLFSIEKVMFNSPLLCIKQPLFDRLQAKLQQNLLRSGLTVDLVTSQYEWNSPLIPAVAVKWGIYNGMLLKNCEEI